MLLSIRQTKTIKHIKTMKTKFVLLILVLFVIGCAPDKKVSVSNDEESGVDVNSDLENEPKQVIISNDGAIIIDVNSALKKEPRYLEDMVESVELIPLETTEASIVGEGIRCMITDKYIYVQDIYEGFRGLVIFERNGKFVRRIFRGNGSTELSFFQNVFYSDGYLYVYGAQKIAKYSSDGEFVDAQTFRDNVVDIQKVGNGFLAIQPQYQNYQKQFKIIQYDSTFKQVSEKNLSPIPFPNAYKSLSCLDGVNCLIYRFADNNIYNYHDGDFKVKYRLEHPDYEYRLTYEDYDNLSQDQQRSSSLYLRDNIGYGKLIFSGHLHNCEDYLFIKMDAKVVWGGRIVFNKKTGKTWLCYNSRVAETIFSAMSESSSMDFVIGQKNSFAGDIECDEIDKCWKHNPNNLLSPKDIEILKNAKADDNPIIVIYKLKDNL